MKAKQSLLVGAAIATVTAGSLGAVDLASADTSTSTTGSSSIVDKIASKFNLSKSDVQAVFDEDRAAHQAEHEAAQKEALATAVKDSKLTQAQADHITLVQNEIKALHGSSKPGEESDTVRSQIKAKIDELKSWATSNNVDEKYIMPGHGGPGGHRGGPRD